MRTFLFYFDCVQWKPTKTICFSEALFLEITCAIPKVPENGRIAMSVLSFAYAIDTTVTFTCSKGYQLIGSPTTICLNTSRWSTNDTTCEGTL